jgi:2'-hydroxyisoflavone reductase
MRLLIIGGTLFLGRHFVEAALARGCAVTLFNRGRTNPDLFPGVERLRGDRSADLSALAGRSWDAVVDTSGYLPGVVRASAAALRDACEHYTFISSASVYAPPVAPGADESAPLTELDETLPEELTPERYGALKARCEQTVEELLPGRALHVRAGLLVGAYDPTGRLSYWTRRIAEGGEVLAPGSPERAVQLIHARDVADWVLDMAARRAGGVYNVTGPAERLPMRTLLERIVALTGSGARLTWVTEEFLAERGVSPWTQLPLWVPEAWNGMLEVSNARARAAGLAFRPLDDTLRDVLAADRAPATPSDGASGSGAPAAATLSRADERALLEEWARRRE